ncbi:MAG TPA: penicillin acylase family protein [Acidimicrobiales bacterium]|nr:penicillin acylase family protein [Acidimicrobiales bacterium]
MLPAAPSRHVAGLEGAVEILRDDAGVPHCFAGSESDAFFAQGWVHATDRLWQLEYDRRRGSGRLAEVLGPRAVSSDLFHRRMDLAETVKRDWLAIAPESRHFLEAYGHGVNAAREAMLTEDRLPTDLVLAEVVPEPWEPWHCLLVFKVRHLLMGSARGKIWRALVTEVLGPAVAASLAGPPGPDEIACVPPGAPCGTATGGTRQTGADDALGAGSNNWALSGRRTRSGMPLLAGDPHRELEMPNVYVQGHLACDAWDVLGLAMPGVPGFPHFAHNADVAWSITHAMVDDQDLYRFGERPEASRRLETIEVRGADPVEVEVAVSRRGPLISPDLALSWTAMVEADTGIDSFWPMLRARSVLELFEAMRPWTAPANNLLAADRSGTIGYQTRGRVPLRLRPEAAYVPVAAEDPSYGWSGFVPFDELPRLLDPDCGFLYSANNPILADPSGPYFGLDTAAPWRARRIVGRLSELAAAAPSDMESIHRDKVAIPALSIAARLGDWSPLASWDGEMLADSLQAAAYGMLRRQLFLLVLERSGLAPHLEDPLNRVLPGVLPESLLHAVIERHLREGDEGLLGGWSWDEALGQATKQVEAAWSGRPWGELHHTAQRHPLWMAELDPPTVAYGGDMDTVQAAGYVPSQDLTTRTGSVARYCFDVSDWDQSGWVVPLGAAGDPRQPHAFDQQDAWREGRLLPARWSREAIEASASSLEALEPLG